MNDILKRLRVAIVELDNDPDFSMIQWVLGELEEIEQDLIASTNG